MKFLLVLLLPLAFLGCANTVPPSSSSANADQVLIETDSFKQQTWVKTPLYLSRQGFTDTFPVQISWRALSKDGRTQFIQLYVLKVGTDWGFYHSANGEDGHKFQFVKVDGQVSTAGGMVTTSEHFALSVPRDYLQKITQKDWKIKVYGRRDEGVFTVPSVLSDAFYQKLVCYEAGTCR
ncbi:MAG: hypothetical protein KIS83_07885 [Rubrivivax sp.]|nr:hypothetical protein [Rubrivivax sp.]